VRTVTDKATCIHQLFEEQVRCTPATAAAVYEDKELTYGELNLRSNQLAHYLKKRGVGPELLVGICLERSLEMIVALLGTLKAGGAYVPIDPAYPSERISFMLNDAKVSIILTLRGLAKSLPQTNAQVVCLDSDLGAIERESVENLPNATAPENLVYVIYTSGSTGSPKAVAIEHRQLVSYVHAISERLTLESCVTYAWVSTFAADLGNTVLFSSLSRGGCLHILSTRRASDANAFSEYTARNSVDCLKIIPSHLAALLSSSRPRSALPKRLLVLGGEALTWSLIERLRELAPTCQVFNHYGPTETTVGATTRQVDLFERDRFAKTVPLGRPLPNSDAYVLDAKLQSAPVLVMGELYIGGEGVARGYLNRPELTAEKFIPDSFTSQPGRRIYKTGDRVRRLPDGNLEFSGRVDHQVKVRGYRVELGDIETALASHPMLRESVVVATEDGKGSKKLIAYVVGRGQAVPSNPELRDYLKERLPGYMVPPAFVSLKSLPLTANGKVDHRALPTPEESRLSEENYLAPRDSIERQIVSIWESLFAVQPIGIRDDFFELGGDSLLGIRLFAQIENECGMHLTLATLLQAATIEQLASILRTKEASVSQPSLVMIRSGGNNPPIYCVHACGGHVLFYRPLARHLGGDRPVYGLQAQGLDPQRTPHTRIEEMVTHYISEIRSLQPEGPYYLVGDTWGGLVAFEIAKRLQLGGHEIALLAMLDTLCPFPISLSQKVSRNIGHLIDSGPKTYFLSKVKSVRYRILGGNSSELAAAPRDNDDLVIEDGLIVDEALRRTLDGIVEAHLAYVPVKRVYPGKITYFLAEGSRKFKPYDDERLNWKNVAGGFDLHVVPGSHNSLREEPYVALVAQRLTECLQVARSARPR
jgi:amino acid adenylation domain-containing protein